MNSKPKFNTWFTKKKRLTLDELVGEISPITIEQQRTYQAGMVNDPFNNSFETSFQPSENTSFGISPMPIQLGANDFQRAFGYNDQHILKTETFHFENNWDKQGGGIQLSMYSGGRGKNRHAPIEPVKPPSFTQQPQAPNSLPDLPMPGISGRGTPQDPRILPEVIIKERRPSNHNHNNHFVPNINTGVNFHAGLSTDSASSSNFPNFSRANLEEDYKYRLAINMRDLTNSATNGAIDAALNYSYTIGQPATLSGFLARYLKDLGLIDNESSFNMGDLKNGKQYGKGRYFIVGKTTNGFKPQIGDIVQFDSFSMGVVTAHEERNYHRFLNFVSYSSYKGKGSVAESNIMMALTREDHWVTYYRPIGFDPAKKIDIPPMINASVPTPQEYTYHPNVGNVLNIMHNYEIRPNDIDKAQYQFDHTHFVGTYLNKLGVIDNESDFSLNEWNDKQQFEKKYKDQLQVIKGKWGVVPMPGDIEYLDLGSKRKPIVSIVLATSQSKDKQWNYVDTLRIDNRSNKLIKDNGYLLDQENITYYRPIVKKDPSTPEVIPVLIYNDIKPLSETGVIKKAPDLVSDIKLNQAIYSNPHEYNTLIGNKDPYKTINERNNYYQWADEQLAGKSKWLGVTLKFAKWNAVGTAAPHSLNDAAKKLLEEGNKHLFSYHMNNVKTLINGTLNNTLLSANAEMISFKGLENFENIFGGISANLDYALVKFEQTKFEEFLTEYKKNNSPEEVARAIKSINSFMDSSEDVYAVMSTNFNVKKGQKAFDFNNYNHRVKLWQGIIDNLYRPRNTTVASVTPPSSTKIDPVKKNSSVPEIVTITIPNETKPKVETGALNGTLIDFSSNPTLHSTNTHSGNASAYTTISERNAYYQWVDKQVEGKSKWFKAADIVTRLNAVGAADGINLHYLNDQAENFLREGNKYLFSHNMNNAKKLLNGTLTTIKYENSFIPANGGERIWFFDYKGKELDYALVQFEQTKVQHFIGEYKKNNPGADMQSIMKSVNGSFEKSDIPLVEMAKNNHLKAVMREKFNDGKSFDFNNYNHRVTLGKALIDRLYAE